MDPLAALRERAFGNTSGEAVSGGTDPLSQLRSNAGISYQQVLEDEPIETKKKKTKAGAFLTSIGTGLTRDLVANVRETASTLDRVLYNSVTNTRGEAYKSREDALQYYQNKQKKIDDYKQKTEDRLKEKLGDMYGSRAANMGRGVGQAATQLAPMLIPGVGQLGALRTAAMLGTTGSLITSASKNDYREAFQKVYQETGNMEVAKKKAAAVGIVSGIVNSAEFIVPAKLIMAERILGKGAIPKLKQFAKTFITESLTEGVQDTAVSTAKYLTYDKEQKPLQQGFDSFIVSLPSSLLFGGVDIATSTVHREQLNNLAKEIVIDNIKRGIPEDQAVTNAVNAIGTITDYQEKDIFDNFGKDILEQSKEAAELYQIEMERQTMDPAYVPDKDTMEFIKEIMRERNIYDMNNAEEVGIIQRPDGGTVSIEIIEYSDNGFVTKITETEPDGTVSVRELDTISTSKEEAFEDAKEQLTDEEIEVGTGPLFRMKESSEIRYDYESKDVISSSYRIPKELDTQISNIGEKNPKEANMLRRFIQRASIQDLNSLSEELFRDEDGRPMNIDYIESKKDFLKLLAEEGNVRVLNEYIDYESPDNKINFTFSSQETRSRNKQLDKTTNKVDTNNIINKAKELITQKYGKRPTISSVREDSTRIQNDNKGGMGPLLRDGRSMEKVPRDNAGMVRLPEGDARFTETAEKVTNSTPVEVNNYNIEFVRAYGFSNEVVDKIKELSSLKNNPITHFQISTTFEGREDFDAVFRGGNTLILNPTSAGTMKSNIITHEFSHAWFQSQSAEKKALFIEALKTQKELIKESWELGNNPHNGYYERDAKNIRFAVFESTGDSILTDQIMNKTGFNVNQISLDKMIDLSFDLQNQIAIINKELSDGGFRSIRLDNSKSQMINEHYAMIAESSNSLESDNEVINNFIEMSDNGTYDFGTALIDKGPLYLRQQDISLDEIVREHNESFAVDADSLEKRIEFAQEYIKEFNTQIKEHPGKKIAKYISRKEGQFIDEQFTVKPFPMNKTEELRNERARKLTQKVEGIIAEYGQGVEYGGSYIVQDVAQIVYNEYIDLIKRKKVFLEDLRDDKKKLAEQSRAQKGITKTLAENAMSALKRSLIPASDRKAWMVKASEIGTDQKKWMKYIEDITAETEQILITQAIKVEKARKRAEIATLRQVNDIAPKMITHVKQTLGLSGKAVPKMSLKELIMMRDEIQKRLDFLEQNGYNFDYSKMQKPTKEQQDDVVDAWYEQNKKLKPKIEKVGKKFVDSLRHLKTIEVRMDEILPHARVLYKKMQKDIQGEINKYGKVVESFYKVYIKLSKIEQKRVDTYLNNKDYDSVYKLFEEKGFDIQIITDVQSMLRDLYIKLRAAGVSLEELNGFFPRLLTRDGKEEMKKRNDAFEAAIKKKEGETGMKLTLTELSDLQTSLLIKGITMDSLITLSDGRYGQSRNIEYLTDPAFIDLYDNSVKALDSYVSGAINLYHQRIFLGKLDPTFLADDMKGKEYETVMRGIASQLLVRQRITESQLQEVSDLLVSLMRPVEFSPVKDFLVNFTYLVGLGQITAAVTQASETVTTLMRFGLPKNLNITASEVGISNRYEVDVEKSSRLGKIVMRPMMFGDKNISARLLVNSVANYIQKIAKGKVNDVDLEGLKKDIEYLYGKDKVDTIMEQIKNYDFNKPLSPEMGMLIYLRSSELRVIDRSDKIKILVDNPFFGVFKNFTIKTLNTIFLSGNKLIMEGYKRKDYSLIAKGVYRKSSIISSLIIAQMSASLIKDLIKGNTDELEDDEWLRNYFLNAFYKLFFMSQFQIENMDRIGGPGAILLDGAILPSAATLPIGLIDTLYKDIKNEELFDLEETKTLKRIPLVGDTIDIIFQRD